MNKSYKYKTIDKIDPSVLGKMLSDLRMKKLTPEQRSNIARNAVKARWIKYNKNKNKN
jgi:hypothetical protein